ncbi:MAG: c-type cytochrome [Deltaproteobacteria bacterium]|nr:c-type cytochrome [Deltaproteobacteria bacterium]
MADGKEKEIDRVEKISYSKYLFVLGTLFFLASVWAVFNEVVTRRSWKSYQSEFNRIEFKRVETEYQEKKRQILEEDKALEAQSVSYESLPDDPVLLSLRQIRLKKEAATNRMESGEYKQAVTGTARQKIRMDDLKQRYQFLKADQEEIYYEWKHAKENKKPFEKLMASYYESDGKLIALKLEMEDQEKNLAKASSFVEEIRAEIKKWERAEEERLKPLKLLEKKKDAILSRRLDLKQVVVDDLGKGGVVQWGAVDRCESCHVTINRAGFEEEKNPFKTHPNRELIFAKHPVEKFGCVTCHGGQGRATEIEKKPLEEGDHAHGVVPHWDDPLRRGLDLQTSCNKCHQDQWKLDWAPNYIQGKRFFVERGCIGCHNVQGLEGMPKAGSPLLKVASKVDPQWLVGWLRNPRDYLPHSKMPKIPLDIDEPGQVEKVASYLLQNSKPFDFPKGNYPGGLAEKGKQVFETVGCYACHSLDGKGGTHGPALDKIASKTSARWIYNWIQEPRAYSPMAKMPSLRLTPQEAADVTAFLMQQGDLIPAEEGLAEKLKDPDNAKAGFLLISQYGCYGCHEIRGFENAAKLSVDLTTFGRKDVVEFDFGDTEISRTWKEWTRGKLHNPRMYLTEKTSSRMPNFEMTDAEIDDLLVFLGSLKKEEVPERAVPVKRHPEIAAVSVGQLLVNRYNCKGCHLIEGEGREAISQVVSDPGFLPPNLMGIGARVRPEWMFHFLKDPSSTKIRNWLTLRMPTFQFSDQETMAFVRYFSGLNHVDAGIMTGDSFKPDPALVAVGAKLASPDYFSCFSCHVQGGKNPSGMPQQWAPDLSISRPRIRPGFIQKWVRDPQKFTPGVNMPGFLPDDSAAPPDFLNGSAQKQAEAIEQYIFSIGK